MRSIIYNGHDFSEYTTAVVLECATSPIKAYVQPVPNTPRTDMIAGRPSVKVIRVRLYLDMKWKADDVALAAVKRTISGWLCAPEGADLVLPDMDGMRYRDVIVSAAGAWNTLQGDAWADIEFTVLNPVAYGAFHNETAVEFEVRGNWETWPYISLTAAAGSQVAVFDGRAHALVLESTFAGGEAISLNSVSMSVHLGATLRNDLLTTSSEFFPLLPGKNELELYGCTLASVQYQERWV